MLYLADVRHDAQTQTLTLKLLAHQKAKYVWKILAEPDLLELLGEDAPVAVGLALVDVADDRKSAQVQEATEWLLEVLQNFLKTGVTAEFLEQEAERAEQWRQSLTLQSQELGRRTLELEARMGQIQELEEKLKQDRQESNHANGGGAIASDEADPERNASEDSDSDSSSDSNHSKKTDSDESGTEA